MSPTTPSSVPTRSGPPCWAGGRPSSTWPWPRSAATPTSPPSPSPPWTARPCTTGPGASSSAPSARSGRWHRAVPAVQDVVDRSEEILERLRVLTTTRVAVERIRCHGDYHLGQVLWTGKDFVLIDFEGEPARSIGQRRLKRPALVDVAGMIRSFHYASRVAAAQMTGDLATSNALEALDPLLGLWYTTVAGMFLRSYLETGGRGVVRARPILDQLATLLGFHLLEKAVYELGYEANSRPDWVSVPAQGILDLLDTAPVTAGGPGRLRGRRALRGPGRPARGANRLRDPGRQPGPGRRRVPGRGARRPRRPHQPSRPGPRAASGGARGPPPGARARPCPPARRPGPCTASPSPRPSPRAESS